MVLPGDRLLLVWINLENYILRVLQGFHSLADVSREGTCEQQFIVELGVERSIPTNRNRAK